MNTALKRIGHHVLGAGLAVGIVAGLVLPGVDRVAAGTAPPDSEPVESSPTTEVTETTVAVEATATTLTTTVPATTATPTTTTTVDAPSTTTEAAPVGTVPPPPVGIAGYGVSVVAVCTDETTPEVEVTNTDTDDILVSVGPASMVLTAAQTWLAKWPSTDGTPDATAKWDAVTTVEPIEIVDSGELTLPPNCPPAPAAVPSAPVWLSATPGNTTVALQWVPPTSDGGSPVLDYIIEQRLADTSDWTLVDDGVGTGVAATVTGLANGTTYYFRVHAVNLDGPGGISEEIKATPRTVPSAPLSLAAAPTNVSGQIRLTWTAPFDGGSPITDYVVHRSLNGTSGWALVNDGVSAATSFVVTGLTNCTRYYFRVYPVNEVGTGPVSSVVNTIPRGAPSAPRSLAAAPTNWSGQIRLTWAAPLCNGGSVITDYVIQRSPNGTSSWTTIADGTSTATAYTVAGLANGTRYYFRVYANNALGTSPASNLVNAIPRTVPTAPRSLTAAATGASGQVRLAWYAPVSNGGTAITDYVIQRSPNGMSWTTISDGVSTATAYTVTGLTNGTRYYFRVYARNAVGASGPSNVANAIPRYVLTAPRSLTATPTNLAGQIRLTWISPLSNGGRPITDYVIQRSPNGSTGWATVADGVNTATAYTVTGLTNGVRYYFRVVARTGTITSPASNIANAIPRTRPSVPRSLAAAPTNLSGQIRLTWLAPASNGGSAITDYIIQRSPNGTTWTTVSDGVGTSWTYTVTGLTNGTRYYFRVFAKNAVGTSPASPTVSAIPRTVPSQPSYVEVEATAEGFFLEWGTPASTGGSAITGYLIQEFIYDTATWVTLGTVGPATHLVFIEAPGEGCGAFRVAAVNAAGRGAFIGPVEDCWP